MTDNNLNYWFIGAWQEEVEREEDDEHTKQFVQRFFDDNIHMLEEFLEYAGELFREVLYIDNEDVIEMMINTMDWDKITTVIQNYYNCDLEKYHTPFEQLSTEAQFFAIIDKEMKQVSVS